MLKAVIMDFDGVIIDTEVIWHVVVTHWFKKVHNYDLPVLEFLKCVGSEDARLFEFLEKERGIKVDQNQFKEEVWPVVQEKTKNLPEKDGVSDFIGKVKAAGLKLALATSSNDSHAYGHLERLGLVHYFDTIVTRDQVENIKPHPDLFLLAAKNLGVETSEAIILEDSENGLKAGIAAGIRVINIPHEVSKYLDFTGCYKLVDHIADINLEEIAKDFQ